MMGSKLQVKSVYGEGSVFSFDLKQKVIKWDPVGNYEDAFKASLHERHGYREKFTAPHAKVLVVDEPTTGLDPEERIRFRNLLSEASSKDTTIILSTHIVGDISSSCADMAMLNQGHVMFTGSPADMLKETEGKVWRLKVNNEQYADINQKYAVISTIPDGLGWDIQVVAKSLPGYDAVSYPPNLEHAYVYFMEVKDKD